MNPAKSPSTPYPEAEGTVPAHTPQLYGSALPSSYCNCPCLQSVTLSEGAVSFLFTATTPEPAQNIQKVGTQFRLMFPCR